MRTRGDNARLALRVTQRRARMSNIGISAVACSRSEPSADDRRLAAVAWISDTRGVQRLGN
ncbi:hypothetical protein DIE22_34235 [Burkholderia sp. Bp9142]|nr:hypothetical protein DIE22_34235 [Burkholderia sp. Bp9142]RQR44775.1 hypothetical protein DIE21_33065 [Burkholderia sp. Bp9140]